MNTSSIKISVIMPVYNAGKFLAPAIDSILNQSLQDFELIIVDDGSTDESVMLCDYYSQKDSRIIVIHQKNKGICAARNCALNIARGEYVTFSDHDDLYLPNLLLDNYNFAKENNLDLVKFCKIWDVIRGKRLLSRHQNYIETQIITHNELGAQILQLNKLGFCSCVWDGMFKRSFLDMHNLRFDTFFKYGGEDYDFIYKCLSVAERIGTNSKPYYHHFIRYNISTSSKYDPNKIEVAYKRFEQFYKMIQILHVNLNIKKNTEEYTRFYIKGYVVTLLMQLTKMSISFSEKVKIIRATKKNNFYSNVIDRTPLQISKYKHLWLLHKLYANNCFKSLIVLYSLKELMRKYINWYYDTFNFNSNINR